ncbi:hypothetical protein BKA62DRAFT_712578 [Auriculariales sp. MPI-PUGE-AT-0066]|nr:hypothetical protein BKA62DRAFT_712578 [Auriculariales sp. MPI-PUGE-AT-0066]
MQYNVRLIALALFLIVVPLVLSAPLGERVDSTNSHLADRAEAKDHVLGTISAQGLFDGLGLGSLPIVGDVLSPVFNIVDGVSGEIMGVLKGILPAELLEQLKGALHPVDGVPIVGGLLDGLLGDLSVNGTSAKNATDIPKNALNVAQLAAISSVLHTMTLVLGSPTAIASQVLPAVTGLAGQTPAAQVINAARGVTGNSPSPLDTVAGIAGIPLGAIQGAANVAPLPAAPINALADSTQPAPRLRLRLTQLSPPLTTPPCLPVPPVRSLVPPHTSQAPPPPASSLATRLCRSSALLRRLLASWARQRRRSRAPRKPHRSMLPPTIRQRSSSTSHPLRFRTPSTPPPPRYPPMSRMAPLALQLAALGSLTGASLPLQNIFGGL